jgi:hypothetical protein
VKNHHGPSDRPPRSDPARSADRLLEDIQVIRGNLGSLIGELDQRRRRAFDVRLQVRRHPLVAVATVTLLAGMVGGAIALGISMRRRHRTPRARLHSLREAVQRMLHDPDRVARVEPSVGRKILAAGGAAAASTLAKRLAQRAWADKER